MDSFYFCFGSHFLSFGSSMQTIPVDIVQLKVTMTSLPTCESEGRWENDVDSCTVDVKHDAEVKGYTADHCKKVHECPVGGV